METTNSAVCIKKFEGEEDVLESDTTELKNVLIVIDADGNFSNHSGLDQLRFVGNSDGNIEIDTIESVEDAIILPIEDLSEQQGQDEDEDLVEGFDDDVYVHDDDDEELLNETEIVDGTFMGEDSFIEDSYMDEKNSEKEEESTVYRGADEINIDDSDAFVDNDGEFEDNTIEEVEEKKYKQKEEAHQCSLCERIFKSTASLKRHVTVSHAVEQEEHDDPLAFELCLCCAEPVDSAHTIGDYKCKECEKRFLRQASLRRHHSMEHSVGSAWPCAECHKVFTERAMLLEHMQLHPFHKLYVCPHCHGEFTRKYHLERHMSQTGCDGHPPTAFECQVCKKMFSRKDNLRDHLRAHAGQSKPKRVFLCNYCKKEFKGSSLLAIHLRTHTGEKPYACDLCPKRFPSSGAMKKHRRMHTGEKPYQCPKCSNTFAAKETLNRHVRTHTGDKPHACHFCGKTFIQAAQLRAHIFHHTGENGFACPHCNRAFNRRNRLTQHIKFVHEGAEPMVCDHCGKSFFRKEDLVRHNYLHSGVKPYECELCGKSFSIKSSLRLHMLTHRREEPCSCDECGRAFIRQDCLMRHMRTKHRDVLEDIMAGAEKRRLQQQLLSAASDAAKLGNILKSENSIWNELTLTDSIKELLTLLVDEATLKSFGWPNAQVDKILDSVIKRCGHKPASKEDFDYIGRLRENAKILFTVVIDDEAVKSLLNNQTVDEVIVHVLRLAKMN